MQIFMLKTLAADFYILAADAFQIVLQSLDDQSIVGVTNVSGHNPAVARDWRERGVWLVITAKTRGVDFLQLGFFLVAQLKSFRRRRRSGRFGAEEFIFF